MSKKLIFTGIIVGIGGFIGGYLFGKKYKAKTYGEAYTDGQKSVYEDIVDDRDMPMGIQEWAKKRLEKH